MEADNEYVAYEPYRQIAFKVTSGPMRAEASYLFEAVAEGTRVTSKIEMDMSGLLSLAEPLIAASLRREVEAAIPVLKDLLEDQKVAFAPGPATP